MAKIPKVNAHRTIISELTIIERARATFFHTHWNAAIRIQGCCPGKSTIKLFAANGDSQYEARQALVARYVAHALLEHG